MARLHFYPLLRCLPFYFKEGLQDSYCTSLKEASSGEDEQVSSMKSDVDYLVDNFCEDWLLKLDREDKVSFGLLSISTTKLIFLLEQP